MNAVAHKGKGRSLPAGFTLLEMIIVLVVLGLAAGLLLTRGPMRSPTLEARAAAADLVRTLRLARTQAIAGNRVVTFTLDAPGHRFSVDGGLAQYLPATLSLATPKAPDPRALAIRFAPDGSASGGEIDIAGGARTLSVDVDWLSGRVRVAELP